MNIIKSAFEKDLQAPSRKCVIIKQLSSKYPLSFKKYYDIDKLTYTL